MSKEATQWAGSQRLSDQTLTTVLKAIAFLADRGTCECTKSQRDIAAYTGLSDRAVRAQLVLLERLEIITRRRRSKGPYGRDADVITISVDRRFDVSKAAIRALRRALKATQVPEPDSASKNGGYRNEVPQVPERGSGGYNTVNKENPYHGGESSVGREVTYAHVTCDAGVRGETSSPDKDLTSSGNVIPLRLRGVL